MESLAVQPVTVTLRTLCARVKLAAPFACGAAGIIVLLHFYVFHNSFIAHEVVLKRHCLVPDDQTLCRTIHDLVDTFLGQQLKRCVKGAAVFFTYRPYLPEDHGILIFAQWGYRTVAYAQLLVRRNLFGINNIDISQAFAMGTCALRRIEREVMGCRLTVGNA